MFLHEIQKTHYEVFLRFVLCGIFCPWNNNTLKKFISFFHEINAMTMLSVLLYILQNNQIFISLAVL